MEKKSFLIALFLFFLPIVGFLLFGCASTRITSFTDPDYSNIQFRKILVVGNTNKLDDRLNLEEQLTKVFIDNGIEAIASYTIFPPTRSLSDNKKESLMLENEIDACLMVYFGERGIQQVQIPLVSKNTTGKMEEHGNRLEYKETTTYIGGQIVDKPYAEFEMKLYDVYNGKMAWIADSFTGGNAYADFNTVYSSFCNKIVDQLGADNIVNTTANKIKKIKQQLKQKPDSEIFVILTKKDGEKISGKISQFKYGLYHLEF